MIPRGFLVMLVSLVALTAGCTQLTQSEIKFLETRELDLAYEEAFTAAANGLFSLGFTVDHSDKDSGILTGSRKDPRVGAKVMNTVLFGVIGLAATSDRTEAISFMLRPLKSDVTLLRMKFLVNGKQILDRNFMTQIWQRIEREAMLDTRPHEEGKGPESPDGRTNPT